MSDNVTGISLRDLTAYCLLHWRSALALLFVCALAGGGYSALTSKGQQTNGDNPEVPAAADEDNAKEENQSETNANNDAKPDELLVELLASRQRSLAEATSYYQNSAYMDFDADQMYASRVIIELSLSKEQPINRLKTLTVAYLSRIRGSRPIGNLAKSRGTTTPYMLELISIVDNSGDSYMQNAASDSADVYVTTLTLQGIGKTAEDADEVCNALIQSAEEAHTELVGSVAQHTMRVVTRSGYAYYDKNILTIQNDAMAAVTSARDAATAAEQSVAPATPKQDDNAVNDTEPNDDSRDQPSLEVTTVKGAITYAAIGLIVYGFALCVRYLFGDATITHGQVLARSELFDMGSFSLSQPNLVSGKTRFDRWLYMLLGAAEQQPTEEAALQMVAANACLYAGNRHSILISSAVSAKEAQQLADELNTTIDGHTFVCCNKLSSEPAAREALNACDAVVFVEAYGATRFSDIAHEALLAQKAEKAVLGLVMV